MCDKDDRRFEQLDPVQLSRFKIGVQVRVVSGPYTGATGIIVLILMSRRAPYVVTFGHGQWTYCSSSDLELLQVA